MSRKRPKELQPSAPVRHSERWSTNVLWPAPIDQRLSTLVDLAIDAGEAESLTRSELLAAIVFKASANGEDLVAGLRDYRKASVSDAWVGAKADGTKVLRLSERRPGRRPNDKSD